VLWVSQISPFFCLVILAVQSLKFVVPTSGYLTVSQVHMYPPFGILYVPCIVADYKAADNIIIVYVWFSVLTRRLAISELNE
jgi:hypothetical protein